MTKSKKTGAIAVGPAQFTTVKGVAEMLVCAERTVYKMINSGVLPAYRFSDKPGASIRVKVEDVLAVMQPVIPPEVYEDMRSRQPGPLHPPIQDSAS